MSFCSRAVNWLTSGRLGRRWQRVRVVIFDCLLGVGNKQCQRPTIARLWIKKQTDLFQSVCRWNECERAFSAFAQLGALRFLREPTSSTILHQINNEGSPLREFCELWFIFANCIPKCIALINTSPPLLQILWYEWGVKPSPHYFLIALIDDAKLVSKVVIQDFGLTKSEELVRSWLTS